MANELDEAEARLDALGERLARLRSAQEHHPRARAVVAERQRNLDDPIIDGEPSSDRAIVGYVGFIAVMQLVIFIGLILVNWPIAIVFGLVIGAILFTLRAGRAT